MAEYVVERLHDLIYRALPPSRWRGVLDPIAALEELRAWVDDDHQWNEDVQHQNWQSLLDDVLASFAKLPHTISALLTSNLEPPLAELKAARESLQLEEVRIYAFNSGDFSEGELSRLNTKLDELIDSSRHARHFEWRDQMVGALLGAVAGNVLP